MSSSSSFTLNELNVHFSSASTLDEFIKCQTINHIASMPSFSKESFSFSPVADEEIRKIIKSKAVGCDDVSRCMIFFIPESILPIITHIINFSFPSIWRKAFVIPLPKISNPTSLNHFRPISILPFLSKILEAAAHKKISNYILENKALSPYQSGFRPGHSTTTALLKVIDDIRDGMENSQITVLILIDFSNAFNTVNHDILLAILLKLGVSLSALEWFSSYLRGRQQAVRVNHSFSDWSSIDTGVPQCGILSPLMFSVFINLITNYLSCSYHLYEDDLQLYIQTDTSNLNSAISHLNDNLRHISEWSKKFGVAVNPNKCQAIIVGSSPRLAKIEYSQLSPILYNEITIPFSSQVKNLGLIVDEALSWNAQVNEVCRKVTASLRSLYHFKNFLPISTKTLLVQSLLIPIIDYADVCYTDISQTLLNKLDHLLNYCIRFIFGLRKFDHISMYRAKLHWLPIRHRRSVRLLCMLFSILYDPLAPEYLKCKFQCSCASHNRNLRAASNLLLHTPPHRTGFAANSFGIRAIYQWNMLPLQIKKASSKFAFKRRLRQYFLAKCA